MGDLVEGLSGLWRTFGEYEGVQISGKGVDGEGDNWMRVAGNLQKVRKSSGRMSSILIQEGAELNMSGHFLKAVVQAVLIFWG